MSTVQTFTQPVYATAVIVPPVRPSIRQQRLPLADPAPAAAPVAQPQVQSLPWDEASAKTRVSETIARIAAAYASEPCDVDWPRYDRAERAVEAALASQNWQRLEASLRRLERIARQIFIRTRQETPLFPQGDWESWFEALPTGVAK